jgi:hypothetical protein
MIEGMIELLIFSYFNYKTPKLNSLGEFLGITEAYFCLILLVILMPLINVLLLILAHKDIEKLDI